MRATIAGPMLPHQSLPPPMKLAALGLFVLNVSARTNWMFVRVRLDDGTQGVGEASLNGWEPLLRAYCAELAEDFRGRDIGAVRACLAT